MSESMIASCVMSGCAALTLFLGLWLRSEKRVKALERDLRQCSEAVCQMIELQMREHRRLACSIDDIEERILGYAAPDIGSPKPVDRRHQVLTLSRKGLALEEITKRLNIPRGEAELILNLRKYVGAAAPGAAVAGAEQRNHAQA